MIQAVFIVILIVAFIKWTAMKARKEEYQYKLASRSPEQKAADTAEAEVEHKRMAPIQESDRLHAIYEATKKAADKAKPGTEIKETLDLAAQEAWAEYAVFTSNRMRTRHLEAEANEATLDEQEATAKIQADLAENDEDQD